MSKKENPFRRIFDVASEKDESANLEPENPKEEILNSQEPTTTEQAPIAKPTIKPKTKGRPKGKKSDPDYEAAIAYIRKKTHLKVKRRLLDLAEEGVKLDFSELVQELLEVWISFEEGAEPDSLIARFSDIRKPENSE